MSYNQIITRTSLTVLCALLSLGSSAMQLSPEHALSRARQSSSRILSPGNPTFDLVYTGCTGYENALYVFNKGDNGFIVVSADDDLPPVLGYSDNGTFDPDKASPELLWWLGQYVEQAAYHFGNEELISTARNDNEPETREMIPAMLTTLWDQGYPFNSVCPKQYGYNCVTGCVATAMAQVMNYHRYPETGIGEHSYDIYGNTYSFDFGSTTFDWDNMLDQYDYATTEQCKAVATLMHACGVAVNMKYDIWTSGASSVNVAYPMRKFFNYDDGIQFQQRVCYSDEDWENLIYAELAAGRPIIYMGNAPIGGHAFVCDGYDEGFFHINWGWGGMGDGMFLLSVLDPGEEIGIGGYEGGFNADQMVIIGIQPPTENPTIWYPLYAVSGMTNLRQRGGHLYCSVKIYNFSTERFEVQFCVKAVAESQPETEYFSATGNQTSFASATLHEDGYTSCSGIQSFNTGFFTDIPAGEYKVYPYFETSEGNLQPLLTPYNTNAYSYMTVDEDGSMTFREAPPVLVSEIILNPQNIAATSLSEIQIRAEVLPKNAAKTRLKWSSSDLDVAEVDENGLVTVYCEGSAIITAEATDGSGVCGECYVECLASLHDVQPTEGKADIYDINGMLIKENAHSSDINSLPAGFYIIKTNTRTSMKIAK